jgi:putative transposase
MWYDCRFRAYPDRTGVTAEAERHIDVHRQAYNHIRYEYNALDTDENNIGSAYQHQKRLTEWKDEWPIFSEVHSKALQKTVERFYDNLSEKKQNGHKVGWLKWKSPREYQFHAFFVLTGALLAEVTIGSALALESRAVIGASGAVFAVVGYAITGNELADRLLGALDRLTATSGSVTVALIGAAALAAVATSGPRTAVVGHAAGLAIGLLAGRHRLLHVGRTSTVTPRRGGA